MSAFKVKVDQSGQSTVLAVHGEVDVKGAQRLRQELVEVLSGGIDRLVIDCTGIDFIDSTGLGVLLGALKRIRSGGGELRLVGVSDQMNRVLRITGLNRVFDIRETLEDAAAGDAAEPA